MLNILFHRRERTPVRSAIFLCGSLAISLCGSLCNFSFTEFHRENTEKLREITTRKTKISKGFNFCRKNNYCIQLSHSDGYTVAD